MSLACKILILASHFVGFCASELCLIHGDFEICEEKCCTGSPNYCCTPETEKLSFGAMIGIGFGCVIVVASIMALCWYIKRADGQGQTNPAQIQQGRARPGRGQPHQVQGQQYQYHGQTHEDHCQPNPGQSQAEGSTQSPNPTQGGPCMSDLPPPYSEVVGPSAPDYGLSPEPLPLSSDYNNRGFNNEEIPERTNLKPSAP